MPERMLDVILIAPGLLEPATQRGGGIEEVDYRVGLFLSRNSKVGLIGCFWKTFRGHVSLTGTLSIEEVAFPANRVYPLDSQWSELLATFVGAPLFTIALVAKLLMLFRRHRPKFVVVHNGLPGLAAGLISKATGRALVFSEGNAYPWTRVRRRGPGLHIFQQSLAALREVSGKCLVSLADVVRVQSESIAVGLKQAGAKPKRIRIIPGGVDVNSIRPTPEKSALMTELKVGYLGRLTKEKGALLLREIIRESEVKVPASQFIIIGSGKLRRIFSGMGNAEVIGWHSRVELAELVQSIPVFIFPHGDVSLAILEMLAAGKAVLVSNANDMREFIVDGENGILCQPHAASFVAGLTRLAANPMTMKKVREKARETAVRDFSWDVVGTKWNAMLDEIRP